MSGWARRSSWAPSLGQRLAAAGVSIVVRLGSRFLLCLESREERGHLAPHCGRPPVCVGGTRLAGLRAYRRGLIFGAIGGVGRPSLGGTMRAFLVGAIAAAVCAVCCGTEGKKGGSGGSGSSVGDGGI